MRDNRSIRPGGSGASYGKVLVPQEKWPGSTYDGLRQVKAARESESNRQKKKIIANKIMKETKWNHKNY